MSKLFQPRRTIGPSFPYMAMRASAAGGGTGVAPTQDGAVADSSANNNTNSMVNTFSSSGLTTTLSSDIILALLFTQNIDGDGAAPQASGVSGAGLGAFALRRRTTHHATHRGNDWLDMEIWWKLAASPLTNEVITASFPSNFRNGGLLTAGFHGCNTSSPFDPNATIASAIASDFDQNTVPTVGPFSITNSGTLLIQMCGLTTDAGGDVPIVASPWTQIGTATSQVSNDKIFGNAQRRGFTTPQSGISAAYDSISGSFFGEWTSIVEVLTS